jgi:hypothetical protein
MNKQDLILIIAVALMGGGLFIISHFMIPDEATKASVYYDNKLVLTIDLSIDEPKTYTVNGYNGEVVIETKKNQIRVEKENSPRHLCSKQGWVTSSLESIVCLPNKIVIKIESTDNKVDAVIR